MDHVPSFVVVCSKPLYLCLSHTRTHTRAHTRTHALTIEALTYTAFLLLFPFSRVSCPPLRLMYGALCRCSPLPASPSLPPSLLSSPANSDEPRASSAASITYLTSSKVHCAPARARACSNRAALEPSRGRSFQEPDLTFVFHTSDVLTN